MVPLAPGCYLDWDEELAKAQSHDCVPVLSEHPLYILYTSGTTGLPKVCSLLLRSSVTQSCLTLCDPMDCSTPGFSVLHYLLERAQTCVHWVDDAIQPSHPLSPSPHPALSLSQHQDLFQWVSSSHQVAKIGTLLGIVIVTDFLASRIFDYWLKMFADFILRFRLKYFIS